MYNWIMIVSKKDNQGNEVSVDTYRDEKCWELASMADYITEKTSLENNETLDIIIKTT